MDTEVRSLRGGKIDARLVAGVREKLPSALKSSLPTTASPDSAGFAPKIRASPTSALTLIKPPVEGKSLKSSETRVISSPCGLTIRFAGGATGLNSVPHGVKVKSRSNSSRLARAMPAQKPLPKGGTGNTSSDVSSTSCIGTADH